MAVSAHVLLARCGTVRASRVRAPSAGSPVRRSYGCRGVTFINASANRAAYGAFHTAQSSAGVACG